MKKIVWVIALILIIALSIYLVWNWAAHAGRDDGDCLTERVKVQQFQSAIGEFGALNVNEAAQLWGKGVQDRNGALQYAVMSDELKKTYKETLDKNNPTWVTGVSSPWVEKYAILQSTKASKDEYSVVMEFSLATSAGSEGKHLATLSIFRDGRYWVINNVEGDEIILGLAGFETKE